MITVRPIDPSEVEGPYLPLAECPSDIHAAVYSACMRFSLFGPACGHVIAERWRDDDGHEVYRVAL